jgi:hypothetical protein
LAASEQARENGSYSSIFRLTDTVLSKLKKLPGLLVRHRGVSAMTYKVFGDQIIYAFDRIWEMERLSQRYVDRSK